MKLMHNSFFFNCSAICCHNCDLWERKLKCIREYKITHCLMVYLSIFTGLIFTFGVNLAHINASNNAQPLCKKDMDKKITQALPSSSLHSKGCVKERCLEIPFLYICNNSSYILLHNCDKLPNQSSIFHLSYWMILHALFTIYFQIQHPVAAQFGFKFICSVQSRRKASTKW